MLLKAIIPSKGSCTLGGLIEANRMCSSIGVVINMVIFMFLSHKNID